ncbi:amino acid ABC transporter substrate-binding protein [Pseudomonas sp. S31]|uniref:substrate-binding periplasmic protein n=1 Tax=Pseudomonas sp. S31 TaxID=1564473 RepID=UPI0019134382|nr:transporter substrate-binding domain-containing protein [Pseudomonas sp. S31]MBK5000215.1 amino acid ABC transporter substrate-binding protein [Pseudomonas sp. S31]
MKLKALASTVVSAACGFMIFLPLAHAAQPLRVGTSLTQMPWGFYDAQQQPTGIDVAMCGAIARHMGAEAQFTNLDYKGLVPALQAGRFDMLCAAMYITPERQAVISMVPYLTASQAVLAQHDSTLAGLADLCGQRVSVLQGSGSLKVLEQASGACSAAGKPAIAIQSFDTQPVAIRALENRSVDAFIATDSLVSYYLQRNPRLKKIATGISPMTLGIGLPRSDPARAQQVRQALAEVQASGEYRAILKQWGIEAAGIDAGQQAAP